MLPYFYCPFLSDCTAVPMPYNTPGFLPQNMPPYPFVMPQQAEEPLFEPEFPQSQSPTIYAAQPMQQMNYVSESSFAPINLLPGDPPPVLSNNPPETTIVLFKELTGYPNYGNPSGNADILYTGNRGTWTFDVPAFMFTPGNLTAQIVIRSVLDDHYNVPTNRYSARITVNGSVVHTGRVPLEHGVPSGNRFNNWRLLTFNVRNLRRDNRVVIENTSSTGPSDWIGFDWMELRLIPR